jgi:hypothetical protein
MLTPQSAEPDEVLFEFFADREEVACADEDHPPRRNKRTPAPAKPIGGVAKACRGEP